MAVDGAHDRDHAQGVLEIVGPDLERSLAFYLALGFTLVRRSGPFAVVDWHGMCLFLVENADTPAFPRWANLRIMVDDVDAVHAHVIASGFEPAHPLADRGYGLRDFIVDDPNGFALRFAQALPA